MKKLVQNLTMSVLFLLVNNYASAQAAKTVFGIDTRVDVPYNASGWSAIGKLITDVGICTATLVNRNIILTAAHCVFKDGRLINGTFKPAYANGSTDQANLTSITYGTSRPDQERGADWALAIIDQDLGNKYGALSVARYSVQDPNFPLQLTVAGYSYDYKNGEIAGVQHNCHTRGKSIPDNFILHDCAAMGGSSGGPALRMINGNLTIVGIEVGQYGNATHLATYNPGSANIVIPTSGFYDSLSNLINAN